MVRAALAVALVWATLVVARLLSQSHLVWAVTGTIAGLGLGWALVSSFRGRLRRRSWMPAVCLLFVVGMATVVARGVESPG